MIISFDIVGCCSSRCGDPFYKCDVAGVITNRSELVYKKLGMRLMAASITSDRSIATDISRVNCAPIVGIQKGTVTEVGFFTCFFAFNKHKTNVPLHKRTDTHQS